MDLPLQDATGTESAITTLFVCTTCRRAGEADENGVERPGRRLANGVGAAMAGGTFASIDVVPVECLSNCSRGCTVAYAAPGKWTYVIGNLDPALHVDDVLTFALLHAQHPSGVPVWRDRPKAIRSGSIARIPPLANGAGTSA